MHFPFPILKEKEQEQDCASNPNRCEGCKLKLDGVCPGCQACGGVARCRMASCSTNCGSCGGFKVAVPAVCIKSPLRPMMMDKVSEVHWDRIPQGRVVKAANHAVLMMNGGKRPMFRPAIDSSRYDNVEVVGVSLWRVWSQRRGWYSADLKDYLGLPSRVKLFTTSLVYDDVLERASNQDVFDQIRERKDIDLFHPLVYSIYTDDSIINQWFAWRRTLRGLEDSGGDFVQVDVTPFSVLKDVKRLVEKIPQMLFHLSMSDNMKDPFFVSMCQRIMFFHKVLPRHVSFWFMGPSNARIIHRCKAMAPGREKWFLTSAPWMAAHKGYEFTKHGSLVRSELTQDELTARAFENYSACVENA